MWGKGGMKRFLVAASVVTSPPAAAPTAVISNITLEPLATLGPESSVMVTTLDFEKGTRTDEIVSVNVDERWRRDEVFRCRVRPRCYDDYDDDLPQPNRTSRDYPAPNATSPFDRNSATVSREPTATGPSASPDRDAAMPDAQIAPPKKYCLASDLSQTISVAQIDEKIMDTPVQLSVRDVLAVSSEVSGYLHE